MLKEHLSGTYFSSDNDVIASVEVFLQGQDELFYKTGIQKLQKRWNKSLKLAEICGKKLLTVVVLCCVSLYMRPETFGTTLVHGKAATDYGKGALTKKRLGSTVLCITTMPRYVQQNINL